MSALDATPPSADAGAISSSGARPAGRAPRILVVGCGGIGGVVTAHLFEQGHDVTALTTNALIADAINAHGLRVRGESSPGTVRGRAVRELDDRTQPFDYILLATQPPQVEEAASRVLRWLAPRGAMVCFQNGLCEPRIAAIAGEDRVLGGIVAWGASMIEPGLYDRTSAGGFVLGRADGAPDDRLEDLAHILEAIGPTSVTSNLSGARWSKLAINCAISSLGTVGGDRLGVLMRHRHVRRLTLEIMTEVVLVARASNIRLEKVSGTLDLDWIALADTERHIAGSPSLFAKHALLLAVGARFRRMRSSMLTAIERGRPPAVDFLNGEVSTRGKKLGIPTPINDAIREEVLAIAAGKAKSSLELLRKFFDKTRALVTPEALAARPPAPVEETPALAEEAPAPVDPAKTDQMEPLPEGLTLASQPAAEPAPAATAAEPSPAAAEPAAAAEPSPAAAAVEPSPAAAAPQPPAAPPPTLIDEPPAPAALEEPAKRSTTE